jgi:N-acetyl-beta-hexosaminidase
MQVNKNMADEMTRALINDHRTLRVENEQVNAINAELEMQAKRDAAEIANLKWKLRSLAQTARKGRKVKK